MSDVSANDNSSNRLRRDLSCVVTDSSRRSMRIVIDEISGRFTRVSADLWQALQSGHASPDQWRQADQVGWTRRRTVTSRAFIFSKFSPLYIRIPIGSGDGIARRLTPWTGWLFSKTAVTFWLALVALSAGLVLSRSQQWMTLFGSLGMFLAQTSPVVLGIWFVITKVIHELAHAVMCRRVGSRCGSVGLLLLCGMPCPYCDVSDTSRNPSAWQRASVMLAGIYVELIIASLAALVWLGARDVVIQWHAFHLMFVCSISTLIFNANPLMRYDGYFVLADWIGSVNLRADSKNAFRDVVVARFAGSGFATQPESSSRSIGLSIYHAASTVYRCFVLLGIAAMLLVVADQMHLRPLMVAVIAIVVIMMTFRSAKRIAQIVGGQGNWIKVPAIRRLAFVIMLMGGGAAILFWPTPRYRTTTGMIDAVDAEKVFLPSDGFVEVAAVDFGDRVEPGQTIVRLRDEAIEFEETRITGQLRIAKVRSQLSRRAAMGQGDNADTLRTLQAQEEGLQARLVSVQTRADRSNVRTNIGGVLLPAESTLEMDPINGTQSLARRVGSLATSRQAWCRISGDGQLHAVITIDARDRQRIRLGTTVRITATAIPGQVFVSQIESVSPIDQETESVVRRAGYEVVCPLIEVLQTDMLELLGSQVRAAVRMPDRTMAEDLWQNCKDFLGE
ncbi:hypothetical protein [Rubripirellula reticaptiva]|uniref:Peptidase family M50 n=1 Tax=Rubripirellula reticaptiva TaxID=2528013 RepID=A0A5C6F2N2_9BACT|nr:hypothetical protein [Rubripirellula reticaptiva]TWU56053.1 Peptidase family M50 [Rubripirellula reticaptiva]